MDGDRSLGALFEQSAAIMARLRGPGGCPWDGEQSFESIRKYTLEETYEVLDAIERRDWPNLSEELGDLLLQVLFYAQMAEEAGHFRTEDVLAGLNSKLVRRHPHVFREEAAAAAVTDPASTPLSTDAGREDTTSHMVIAKWRAMKAREKEAKASLHASNGTFPLRPGYLDDVLRAQSAVAEAAKLGSAAAEAGFDWPDVKGLIAKVREETSEIEAELDDSPRSDGRGRLAEEVGDLLFTAVQLARHLKVDAEMTLRDSNAKFRRRFQAMERANESRLEDLSADELERAWTAAKLALAPGLEAEGKR